MSGWEGIGSKPFRPMGTEGYGEVPKMKPSDYYDKIQGFDKSPI